MHAPGLGTWTARRRLKSPDAVAVVFGEETTTYRQLADAVDGVAALLHQRGVARGDTVAHLGENSPTFLQVLFACAQLGAVFVPVNTRLAPPEMAHVLTDSAARLLVVEPELAGRAAPALEAAGLTGAGLGRTIVTGEGTAQAPGLARLLRSSPARSPVDGAVDVGPDDPVAVIYTSGTTGRAKGAVLTHGNLTWAALNSIVDYDIVSTDVALMISPLFHVASLGMGALPVVLKGATLVLERSFDPGRALAQIQRHRVTMLSGVPTTFQLLADHPDWPTTDLSSLGKLTCGGSAVPPRILDAYEERGLAFSQGYGMTETSPGATSLPPSMTLLKQGSVGLPHFFTDVRVSGDHGAVGGVGEVEVAGPNVFAGYLGLPDATASSFTADGWFRTGDLGSLDDDGYLHIADRLKDMIISGGENVYSAEVENALSGMDGITDVAVIGVPDERWGEVPCAVVTVREGAVVDTAGVRAFLDGKIARYKIPASVVVVDELVRTASGKVRKAELRARLLR